MPVWPRDTSSPDSVTGFAGVTTAELTRPSDVNAYVANDAITTSTSTPALLAIPSMGRINGAKGKIKYAKISTDQLANVARYRVHLFNVNNPFIPPDNSTVTTKWADRASYQGYFDFPAVAQSGGPGADVAYAVLSLDFLYACAAADNKLYAFFQTLDAFTPANAQKFHLALRMDLY
jgi:hypothetical protein